MKLPSKKELKELAQYCLLLYMTTKGFIYSYMSVWFLFELPSGWQLYLVTTVLGILSGLGLFHWIERKDNGKTN